jgi:hypothetical protein
VGAKLSIEHFSGFWLRVLGICHGLFDADNFVAFRTRAKAMTKRYPFRTLAQANPPSVNSGVLMSPVSHTPSQYASLLDFKPHHYQSA